MSFEKSFKDKKDAYENLPKYIENLLVAKTDIHKKSYFSRDSKLDNYVKNNTLEFKLGYSHTKNILLPTQITDHYLTKNSITIESLNLSWLGNFIVRLKNFKTPDIYKGKGLHIKNQKVLTLKPIKKK